MSARARFSCVRPQSKDQGVHTRASFGLAAFNAGNQSALAFGFDRLVDRGKWRRAATRRLRSSSRARVSRSELEPRAWTSTDPDSRFAQTTIYALLGSNPTVPVILLSRPATVSVEVSAAVEKTRSGMRMKIEMRRPALSGSALCSGAEG